MNEALLQGIETKLSAIGESWQLVKELPGQMKSTKEALDRQEQEVASLRRELDKIHKGRLGMNAQRIALHPGEPTAPVDLCKYVAAMAVIGAAKAEQRISPYLLDKASAIIGLETKTALSASDIPLPEEYSATVAELVSMYGTARRYGTVIPVGSTSKLPRLKTSPAFALVALSSGGAEKSPQTEWVTFTPSKWGGLVRIPSEIDDDSIFNLGQFLLRYCVREMAKIEDVVFWTADGTGTYDSLSGLAKSVVTNSKTVAQASTKTHYSDFTLAKMREMRTVPDEAVLGTGAYFFHPSFESLFSGFNTAGDKPYIANGINGASVDGFPIRWINTLPAYSTSVNVSKVFGLFGDPSWQYLGVRGGIRFDTSRDVFFANDELALRALERFTIGLMAVGSVSGIITAAS